MSEGMYPRAYHFCTPPCKLTRWRARSARGGKIATLREYFKDEPNFEAVQIDDVGAPDLDLTAALEGGSWMHHGHEAVVLTVDRNRCQCNRPRRVPSWRT